MLALSTAVAVVAASCHWLSIDLTGLAVLEFGTVIVWWKFAELRDCPTVTPKADQAKLRAEVQRWLEEREKNSDPDD